MSETIIIENLPRRAGKGTLLRLLIEVGKLPKDAVGRIELRGGTAVIEVDTNRLDKLLRLLDGAKLDGRFLTAHQDLLSAKRQGSNETHWQRLAHLLQLEAKAEADQLAERIARSSGDKASTRSSVSHFGLTWRDERAGLGGRFLLTFGKRNPSDKLPYTSLGVGSPVLLTNPDEASGQRWRGLISRLTDREVEVAVDELPDLPVGSSGWRIDLSDDAVTTRRQLSALARVAGATSGRLSDLRDILLSQQPARFNASQSIQYFDNSLNEAQKTAVSHALAAEDIAIIHGPPGTGKTTTVVELIRQAVANGERVLACAPSNMAVDNLFEKLLATGVNALRLGHPARVLPELRAQTLDVLAENHPNSKLAGKMRREAEQLFRKADRFTRAKPAPGEKRGLRDEAKSLRQEAWELERRVVDELLDKAAVLCVTLTGLSSRVLGQRRYDLCVIDEAGQSVEPSSWIPIQRSQRLILAGDPFQLPPTVISPEATRKGLSVSLLERLMTHEPTLAKQLIVQYRMHPDIMTFSSREFYESTLIAADSVSQGAEAVTFIDTAGASYDEAVEPDGESRYNEQEATLLQQQVDGLLAIGFAPEQIGVITPYSAQVRLLLDLLPHAGLEIGSVDAFQGREKEAIVISLVRSNEKGEIGFLAETRRLNVALTRAKQRLIVIGDSATLTTHPFFQRLVTYFEEINAYRSVWELM